MNAQRREFFTELLSLCNKHEVSLYGGDNLVQFSFVEETGEGLRFHEYERGYIADNLLHLLTEIDLGTENAKVAK